MKAINRVVFWEPSVSPHKTQFISALSELLPNTEIIYVAEEDLAVDRKALGWTISPLSPRAEMVVKPSLARIDELVARDVLGTLHVFSGIRWIPTIVAALDCVRKRQAKFAIMSEPRVSEGLGGAARFIHSWFAESWVRRSVQFVLAQGRNGPTWFNSVGYPRERVFCFGYFIDPPPKRAQFVRSKAVRIGYVGRLVEQKGVSFLAKAVHGLAIDYALHYVGAGSCEAELKALCSQLRITAHFPGVVSMESIGSVMRTFDVLVLPSTTKDGWGVVVNEGLLCGTAVIATNCVGASIVLDDPSLGLVVPPRSPDAIADAVCSLRSAGAFEPLAREHREKIARRLVSATAGAELFRDICSWRFEGAPRPRDLSDVHAS